MARKGNGAQRCSLKRTCVWRKIGDCGIEVENGRDLGWHQSGLYRRRRRATHRQARRSAAEPLESKRAVVIDTASIDAIHVLRWGTSSRSLRWPSNKGAHGEQVKQQVPEDQRPLFGALQDALPITCRPAKAFAAHHSPVRPISSELCLFLTLPPQHIAARRAS